MLNRLLNFISERGSQNITVFGLYKIIIRLNPFYRTIKVSVITENNNNNKRFIKNKSSRSSEAELHDFYNNNIILQLDLTEDKNTEVKIL